MKLLEGSQEFQQEKGKIMLVMKAKVEEYKS
jgi:hypothetical protein